MNDTLNHLYAHGLQFSGSFNTFVLMHSFGILKFKSVFIDGLVQIVTKRYRST